MKIIISEKKHIKRCNECSMTEQLDEWLHELRNYNEQLNLIEKEINKILVTRQIEGVSDVNN